MPIFTENTIVYLLYFFYGLSFFTMGFGIFLKKKTFSRLRLAETLWLLAFFGILLGLREWVELYLIIGELSLSAGEFYLIKLFSTVLMTLSFFFLFQFGMELLHITNESLKKLNYIPFIFFILWLILVNSQVILSELDLKGFLLYDNYARYILALPGSLVTAYALIKYSQETRELDIHRIPRNLKIAGLFFIFFALFGGIIQNSDGALAEDPSRTIFIFTLIPIEAVLIIVAIGIAFSILSTLDIFDIDTRNRIIEEVKEKNREIIETKQYLSSIVNGSADAIISLDVEGRVKSWNGAAQRLFDVETGDILEKPMDEALSPEGKKEFELIDNIIEKEGLVANHNVLLLTRSHRKYSIDISGTILKDSAGKNIGKSYIIHDITEKRAYENQLIQADKMSSLGLFAAGVAHQISNPLTGILINAENIKKPQIPREKKEKMLDNIIMAVENANQTIRALLDFSRQMESELVQIDLKSIIDTVLNLISFKVKNVNVIFDYSDEPYDIVGDPNLLQQVFLNIIVNGVQATENGGDVKITTRRNGGFMEVEIQDNGGGIPPEILNKIFDPFFTTKKMGEGTGLGLSVSHGIIEKHKGYINVKSKIGEGTIFTIGLPG